MRYAISLSGNVVVEPFAGPAHVPAHVHVDSRSIVEEGSTVAAIGEAHPFDAACSTLGVRIVATMPTGAGLLTFKGMLGWRHAFGDTVPEATLSYGTGGTPVLVAGTPIDRDGLVAEAGLDRPVREKVTLGLAWTGAIGRKSQEQALKGSLSVRF